MNKLIVYAGILFSGCYYNDPYESQYVCPHDLEDTRFNEFDNDFYFGRGTYWIYKDTLTGVTDSQYVIESWFKDALNEGCQFDFLRRSGKVYIYSTYYKDTIIHSIQDLEQNAIVGSYAKWVTIVEPNQQYYVAYRIGMSNGPSYLFLDSTLTIQNYTFQLCDGYFNNQDTIRRVVVWARNIGIIRRQVHNLNTNSKQVWELEKYFIKR